MGEAAVTMTRRERATVKRARRILKREREKQRERLQRRFRTKANCGVNVWPVRQREPRLRDRAYLIWLRRWSCVACMVGLPDGGGPVEAAHPKFGIGGRRREFGLGEKSHDRFAVPLCSRHHRTGRFAEHQGQRAFWATLGVDVAEFAQALSTAFDAGDDGDPIIQEFAREASR